MSSPTTYKLWQRWISSFLIFLFLVYGVFVPGSLGVGTAYADAKTKNDLVVVLVEESLFDITHSTSVGLIPYSS